MKEQYQKAEETKFDRFSLAPFLPRMGMGSPAGPAGYLVPILPATVLFVRREMSRESGAQSFQSIYLRLVKSLISNVPKMRPMSLVAGYHPLPTYAI